MPVILKNNASSTLATAITTSDTGIVVANGSQFPTITSGDYFYVTLVSQAGQTEIVKVTARVGNSMTVVRAQDGSSAASFQVGTLVDMRVNVASVLDSNGDYTTFDTVSLLLADTTLTYTTVSAGDVVQTRIEGFAYVVAASGATDQHVTTAGGVKLYVQPSAGGGVTPQQFGATTDAADSSAEIEAAAAYADKVAVPEPLNYPSAVTVPNGAYEGPKSLIVNGNKAARYRSAVKSEPERSTSHSFIGTSFDGDFSKVPFPIEHYILGAATLGQPSSGYLYTPEATPHYTNMYNAGGHNQETTSNGGRTGAAAYRTQITHVGDGDAVAYNASIFVSGAKTGATGQTGFLANPAGVLLNGSVIAGNDGVYLNNLEINLEGKTYDVAGVGCVFNFTRNNDTGALGAGWDGIRLQSVGSHPIDAGLRFVGTGGFEVGVNFVEMVSSNNAAIAMKAGQRIYLDSVDPSGNIFDVTLNDTHISVPSLGGGLNFVVNSNPVLQLAASAATRTQHLAYMDIRTGVDSGQTFGIYGSSATSFLSFGQIGAISYVQAFSSASDSTTLALRTANAGTEADGIVLGSTGIVNIAQSTGRLQINGTQVLNARQTGWTAATGTATRTTFATSTVTTAQLAERVKGLIDDLITHGLIGA